MEKAFIVGNGITRQEFDLNKLTDKGVTFGCNALYRDYKSDYLIAIDPEIIKEVHTSDYPQHRFIVPPEHEQYEPPEFNPVRTRSNAGMNAMTEAIKRGHNLLFCLGFDFLVTDTLVSLNNVYDGTNGYGKEVRATDKDNEGRTRYLEWFVRKYPNVGFVFLLPREKFELRDVYSSNVAFMYYDDFEKEILNGEDSKVHTGTANN